MFKVKPRQIKQFAQHHMGGEGQSWDLNPGLAGSKQAVIEEEHLPRLGMRSGRASWRSSLEGWAGAGQRWGGEAFQAEGTAGAETECGDLVWHPQSWWLKCLMCGGRRWGSGHEAGRDHRGYERHVRCLDSIPKVRDGPKDIFKTGCVGDSAQGVNFSWEGRGYGSRELWRPL